MSASEDDAQRASGGGRGTPPPDSAGGDLIDQVRERFDRLRERVIGRGGVTERAAGGRAGRRVSGRTQAVPLGSEQGRVAARQPDRRMTTAGRADRAERNAYTLVFAVVLLTLVVGLFFALSWALGADGPFGSGSSSAGKPAAQPGGLAGPAPLSSPLPFASPSPSPSPEPSPEPGPLAGRVHVVEGGDTLNRIAQRYGVTVDQILRANNFTDRNRILRIGERLVIPEPGAVTGSPIPR